MTSIGPTLRSLYSPPPRYVVSGTARARLSAGASLARIVRSAWSRTRSIPRKRSGNSAPLVLQASELVLDGGTAP